MDTIYALSSGGLPSGVAVVRLSGRESFSACERLCGLVPGAGELRLLTIRDPESLEVIDRGLVCSFRQPNSFTGEDVIEFHVHGGIAVVNRLLGMLRGLDGMRLAEAGEFSKRAFENGKLDLTQAEGLSDLINSETEIQRRMALDQASGGLRELLEGWRQKIIRARAYIEAELDFTDEEDVPDSLQDEVNGEIEGLIGEITSHLNTARIGEIIRDGYRIALMGPPNAGKSSLLNALVRREVAIVTDVPGTTRDVLEARLDISGYSVIVSDTAGLRDSADEVEKIGVDRAKGAGARADLILWLNPIDHPQEPGEFVDQKNCVVIRSKDDLGTVVSGEVSFNTVNDKGIDPVIGIIQQRLEGFGDLSVASLMNRERHRLELEQCHDQLESALEMVSRDIVIGSEHLRKAGDHLGRLTGRFDVEDLLDVIFSEFCVGK